MTVHTFENRKETLFHTFVRLKDIAHRDPTWENCDAAGKAWAAFVNDYLPPETRDRLEAIKFPNRRS